MPRSRSTGCALWRVWAAPVPTPAARRRPRSRELHPVRPSADALHRRTSCRRAPERPEHAPGRTIPWHQPSDGAAAGQEDVQAVHRRRVPAPDEPPLLGLVSRIAPVLTGGNSVIALASETQPLCAVELAEVIATSDVPGGVVNILTGFRSEVAPWLAAHMDVNAIDITG